MAPVMRDSDEQPPIWLLDVDGVINAFADDLGWGEASQVGKARSAGRTYTLQWAQPLIERIRSLHESGLVEVQWCTTWCPDADQLEQLWGLPYFERSWTEDLNGFPAIKRKIETAQNVLRAGRRLIWTDDDVTPLPGSSYYEEMTADGRALLIAPLYRVGLQPEDLDAIEAFAKEEV